MSKDVNPDNIFNELYDKYSLLVMEIVLGIISDKDLALDAFQNTFVAISRNQDKLCCGSDETRNYISATAHHMAIKLYKKYKRIHEHEFPFPEEDAKMDIAYSKRMYEVLNVNDMEDMILDRMDRIRVCEELGKMRKKEYDLINDFYYKDLSLEEIGEKYGISDDAAQKRVSRSVNKLKKTITN